MGQENTSSLKSDSEGNGVAVLPEFTDADPVIAGEGSLDPLGLASMAEQLAEALVPGVRARMQRIRFVTAAAVGALATDDLHELPPADQVSTPSLCFEWLVLTALSRSRDANALNTPGIPGSSKSWAVEKRGERLSAKNYLKSPGVFGFTGVYLPLSRDLGVLDESRRPGPQGVELARAWEVDNPDSARGFVDCVNGSPGNRLRSQIRSEVENSLRSGRCSLDKGSRLNSTLASVFHPTAIGQTESALLQRWLTESASDLRAELARLLPTLASENESQNIRELLDAETSGALRSRLCAVRDYETLANILTTAFREVLRRSTVSGSKPVVLSDLVNDDVIARCHDQVFAAFRSAEESVNLVDGFSLSNFQLRLHRFASPTSLEEFVIQLLDHHEEIQANKPPNGKRPWFDRYGEGIVVRSLYYVAEDLDFDESTFVHPYRLFAMKSFLKDLGS